MPELNLEGFLTRYKTERRRKRMAPLYRDMLGTVQAQAEPKGLLEHFHFEALPTLHPYTKQQTAHFCLGLCTLGQGLDHYIGQIGQEDIAAAAVAEEVALALIVAITNEMRPLAIDLVADDRLKSGPAFRPGVGRWPIDLQRFLFEKLPADKIGITLSEFMVMTPHKSTSVIIPLRLKSP